MESPLFEQHFLKENWQVLYFDAIRNGYLKTKDKMNLDSMTGNQSNVIRDEMAEYQSKKQIDIFSRDDHRLRRAVGSRLDVGEM